MKQFELQNSFGIDSLVLTEAPEPQPGHGQVLLRIRAVSLNYRDLMMVRGHYNPHLRLPIVPCSDGVGEVVAVGEGVRRVKPGDRVAGTFFQDWIAGGIDGGKIRNALGGGGAGMLTQYVVLNEPGVVHVPDHLTDEEASTLPCAAVTAWNSLTVHDRVKPGDTVLIQGTGGVSLFALQFALLAGARVIATSSSDEKLARVAAMGASAGINYRTEPEWDARVLELTEGRGVDHVVEVGGAGTLPRSLQAVRMGGQVSLIGVLSGASGEINPLPVLMKQVRLQGIYVGSREMFEAMNAAIALHQLRPVVDRVFPFAEAPEALRYLESAAHFGKIVIRVAE